MLKRDIRAEKNALRQQMKDFRRGMPSLVKEKKDAAIRRGVQMLRQYQTCDTLLTFVSSPIEVDTKALIEEALQSGKKVAVPYCIDGTRRMDFYYIRSLADLAPRTFGVLEPVAERCEKLTDAQNSVCIVPGLAFDRHGFRLGYGKGYYDRFLSGYTGFKIGIVYEGCLRQRLPHGYYDVPVDLLVTEKRRKKPLLLPAKRKKRNEADSAASKTRL
ncbi:MAG: 5-formyltetrahydrofolate cyclo-ligase [Oscillospiraceae bacterium]|nr:5-formyltetrahydrofolate cyclo-ligase [Oscillospiraceae bacterium]